MEKQRQQEPQRQRQQEPQRQRQLQQVPVTETAGDIRRETNTRIYDRNIPSQGLQPYISVRPVSTKYSYLPIVDPRREISVPSKQFPTFNVNSTFNPGNTQSPYSGFASNINLESELRNQIYALQKCSQSVYVPSSNSDLYDVRFQATNTRPNPHELLFQEQSFDTFNPNPAPELCGSNLFYNTTRCQIKELTKQKC
jgi:hypothetical protein